MINSFIFSHRNIRISFTYLLFIVLASQFWSCQKKDENLLDIPVELEESLFNLEWATRMDSEKEIVNLAHGVSYSDWYIRSGDKDDPSKIMAFHKDTGTKEWELVFDELQGYQIVSMHLHEHLLVCNNAYFVFAIDIESRSIIWKENLRTKGMRLGKSTIARNNKYYINAAYNFDPLGGGVAHIYEFDIFTGANQKIYSNPPDSLKSGTKTISPPVYWKNNMIVFNEFHNSELPPENVKQYIVLYNLNTKTPVWKSKVVNHYASNKLISPVIYRDIVITGGASNVFGFDLQTGTTED